MLEGAGEAGALGQRVGHQPLVAMRASCSKEVAGWGAHCCTRSLYTCAPQPEPPRHAALLCHPLQACCTLGSPTSRALAGTARGGLPSLAAEK